ncbi:MAG: acyl-CoA dehydrogenase family protein [Acidobacteriota bacterium]
MSTFALNDTQSQFLAEARRLTREVLRPLAEKGEEGRVNRPLLAAAAQVDLLPRLFPKELGGSADAVSAMDLCLLREGIATECSEAETAVALQGLGSYPILQSGRPELAARFIPEVAAGRMVAAFALTEPEAGSDPANLQLAARRDGDDWVLSGSKIYISNAPEADVYTIFARTGPGEGAKGVTAFALPGDAEGLSGQHLELLAPHPIGTLELDDVRLPGDHVLGEVGEGFKVALRTLDLFRPSVGAFAVGMGQSALDAALARAASREQFGKSLSEFQGLSHRLAEAATNLEASRLLVYRAAAAHDSGRGRTTKEAAMAKLHATETAQAVVDLSIQVHGASGLVKGHLLEHLYREVRAPRIYEGTSEIQRDIIARQLFRSLKD